MSNIPPAAPSRPTPAEAQQKLLALQAALDGFVAARQAVPSSRGEGRLDFGTVAADAEKGLRTLVCYVLLNHAVDPSLPHAAATMLGDMQKLDLDMYIADLIADLLALAVVCGLDHEAIHAQALEYLNDSDGIDDYVKSGS